MWQWLSFLNIVFSIKQSNKTKQNLADRGNAINIVIWSNKYKTERLVVPERIYAPFYILNSTSTVPSCNGLLFFFKQTLWMIGHMLWLYRWSPIPFHRSTKNWLKNYPLGPWRVLKWNVISIILVGRKDTKMIGYVP